MAERLAGDSPDLPKLAAELRALMPRGGLAPSCTLMSLWRYSVEALELVAAEPNESNMDSAQEYLGELIRYLTTRLRNQGREPMPLHPATAGKTDPPGDPQDFSS